MSKACKVAGFFLILSLSTGCAYFLPQSSALIKQYPDGILTKVELTQVPFYPQEKYQCGPATLAMALNAAGVSVRPEELVDQIYIPARKGSLQVEMIASTRRHGLIAYELAPNLADVLKEINGGTPVIVLENYSFGLNSIWHYSIAIGFDLNEKRIIRRSGLHAYESMPFGAFEYLWKSDGHWAMVAISPDRLPATATLDRYLNAVMALERSGQIKAAHIAYGTLLKQWPDSLAGQMGLGNTAYAMHDLVSAKDTFLKATQDHPEAVAAFNNLAMVYLELGETDAAIVTAEHAVSLGGTLIEEVKSTLYEIKQKLKTDQLTKN